MTNFEKLKEELRIEDADNGGLCAAINRMRNEHHCIGRTCEECREWLEEEYAEPVELTEVERVILENIDKEYEYIARDKDGEVRFFIDKPQKRVGDFWSASNKYGGRIRFNNLFQFIKWKDTEPYEIAKLLEEG